jgi:hypothetical protein
MKETQILLRASSSQIHRNSEVSPCNSGVIPMSFRVRPIRLEAMVLPFRAGCSVIEKSETAKVSPRPYPAQGRLRRIAESVSGAPGFQQEARSDLASVVDMILRIPNKPKSSVISTIFFLFLFLLGSGSYSFVCAWEEKRSDHFVIQHHPKNETLAESILHSLEKAYPLVTLDIGYTLQQQIRVYITISEREFQTLTRNTIPDWGIGCAFPDSWLIVLKAEPETVSGGRLNQIAVHELTHVVLGQALQGKRAPRWFDEGLAMYESHEWNFNQSVTMAKAVFTRSIIPLKRIDYVLSYNRDKAQLAYTQSLLAVSYLMKEYGLEKFHEIVRTLAKTGDIDRTLTEVVGLRFGEFEARWYKHVGSKYGWISLFTNSFYLWIGIAILFILAFLIKIHRSKKIKERWETEDEGYHFEDEQDYYDY